MANRTSYGRGEQPDPVNVFDLFPTLSEDIDRRISHAETRIKNWVMTGILVNLFTLLAVVGPSVYYLGKVSMTMESAIQAIHDVQVVQNRRGGWMLERTYWESRMEDWAVANGYKVGTTRRPSPDEMQETK